MRAGDYPYFDTRFMALAHRGGAAYPPNLGRENTLAAFANAVQLGYRYIETDVQVSSDGEAIVFHDDTLERVAIATGPVAALTAGALRAVTLHTGEPIPTLTEALDAFPDVRFNIDVKADAAVEPLFRAIKRTRAEARVCIGSFSATRLNRFRRLAGASVATSCGPWGVGWFAYGIGLRRLRAASGVALQIPRRIWRDRLPLLTGGLVATAHRAGRVVHVWTVDEAGDMEALIDAGVDGIVTDRIDVLKDVLVNRNLWDG